MILFNPQWWTTFTSIVSEVWNITTMIVDILSVALLLVVLMLTVIIRIAIWIPGDSPERELIKVRDYLTKFIDRISLISKKKT